MNVEQILGMIRQFLPFVGGILTILGWNKDGKFDAVSNAFQASIGPIMLLGSAVWSFFSKTDAALVSTAASVPGVNHITLSDTPAGNALAPNTVTPANVILPAGNKPL